MQHTPPSARDPEVGRRRLEIFLFFPRQTHHPTRGRVVACVRCRSDGQDRDQDRARPNWKQRRAAPKFHRIPCDMLSSDGIPCPAPPAQTAPPTAPRPRRHAAQAATVEQHHRAFTSTGPAAATALSSEASGASQSLCLAHQARAPRLAAPSSCSSSSLSTKPMMSHTGCA